jgi:Rps23 Pro-64 3,4-dihydroxylase Tpa1-like proline 4-hydroxylase
LTEFGELVIHCENLFFEEFPLFLEVLKSLQIKENKLSYFITLQEAEEGGELCCFDLNWKNVKTRIEHSKLIDKYNNTIFINENRIIKREFVKPNAGDLLLFAGGNTWHKVEKVKGNKSRITLGGFIAETTEEGKFYIWA